MPEKKKVGDHWLKKIIELSSSELQMYWNINEHLEKRCWVAEIKTVGLKEKSQVHQRQVETETSKFSRQAYNFQGDFR